MKDSVVHCITAGNSLPGEIVELPSYRQTLAKGIKVQSNHITNEKPKPGQGYQKGNEERIFENLKNT